MFFNALTFAWVPRQVKCSYIFPVTHRNVDTKKQACEIAVLAFLNDSI